MIAHLCQNTGLMKTETVFSLLHLQDPKQCLSHGCTINLCWMNEWDILLVLSSLHLDQEPSRAGCLGNSSGTIRTQRWLPHSSRADSQAILVDWSICKWALRASSKIKAPKKKWFFSSQSLKDWGRRDSKVTCFQKERIKAGVHTHTKVHTGGLDRLLLWWDLIEMKYQKKNAMTSLGRIK